MALHYHLTFGSQVIFTYGPLGFLAVGNALGMTTWYGDLALISLLNAILVRYLLSVAILQAARRTYGLLAGFLLAVVGVAIASAEFADLSILLIALVWAARTRLDLRTELIVCAVAGGAAAVELLEKVSLGATAVVMVAIYALSMNRGRRRALSAAAGGAGFVVVLALLWIALDQPLTALPGYIRVSYEITSGYSAAMSATQSGIGWALTAAFVLGAYGLWAVGHATRDMVTRRRVGVTLLWLLFWFSAFKEGFVRADSSHAAIFFGAMVGGLFAFRLRWGYRKLGLIGLAMAVCVSLASLGASFTQVVHPAGSVSAMVSDAHQLISPGDRSKLVRKTRSNVLKAEPLPRGSLALLRGHTVAIYPEEIAVVWAYRLNWQPLPVLQSYSAYTSWLDNKDAEFLASRRAPSRLIVQAGWQSIDYRFLSFDEPKTALQIFCRYKPLLRNEQYGIFARTSDRCSRPKPIETIRAAWGQTIHVPTPPGSRWLVIGKILGTQPSGLEALVGALFKPAERAITIRSTWLRLVPGTAGDGLPLLTSGGVDYPYPYSVTAEASTFVVTKGSGPQPSSHDALTYRFFAIRVGRQ